MERRITDDHISRFVRHLEENERSRVTISKYLHDVRTFVAFSEGTVTDKCLVMRYKEFLGREYTVSGANSMIAALNSFLRFLGWEDCCVKQFKVQRRAYCSEAEELTRAEYVRLISAAERRGNDRLSLVIQTICGTGIRVSELEYVTVEAARRGEAEVSCKGKLRTVFIVPALRKKLMDYAGRQGLKSGPIFVTKRGKPICRSNVWREMKSLCDLSGVRPEKVFPHNLRHLFARTFYGIERNIVKLADVLGHSSIDTTRIYVVTTGAEHKRRMENMHLII